MSASTEKKNRQAARQAGTDKKMLAAQEAAKKQAQSRRRWTIGSVLVILLIAAILFLNSGYLYSSTSALSIGDRKYSPAEVNYNYAAEYMNFANQYGSYASIFGLDTSGGLAGLDSQSCPMLEDGSWKDYFLESAESSMLRVKALTDYAAANGIALDDEEIAQVDEGFAGLDDYAKSLGYSNANGLLAANYGNGVNQKLVRSAQLESTLANKAYQHVLDSFTYSDAELEDYYTSLDGSSDMFSYAYYRILAETVEQAGTDGESTQAPTEETLQAAKAEAEAIVQAYQDGEGEDALARFQQAVAQQTDGEGSAQSSRSAGSSLNSAYQSWLMDTRSEGDLTMVEDGSDTGYYVVLYLERDDNHYPVAQVRHILVKAEADENGNYSEQAKADAKARAEEILAEWEAGDRSEESFANLAEVYSEDGGSNMQGGLYDSVAKGQMVGEFDAFCFADHKSGDTGIVYGESSSYAGYHVMYYVGQGDLYSQVIARNDLNSEAIEAWMNEQLENYEAHRGFWHKLVG